MQPAMEAVIQDDFDWDRLHRSKQTLVMNIWHQPESELWFLVELVDEMQQKAIDNGVWAFPEKTETVRKSEVLEMEVQEGDLCWDSNRAVGMEWRGGRWVDVPYSTWVARHSERS